MKKYIVNCPVCNKNRYVGKTQYNYARNGTKFGRCSPCQKVAIRKIHRPLTLRGTWNSMINRCMRPSSPEYERYALRGITICNRWLLYDNFYDDMIGTFKQGLSLDRIDNDGNYEPSNCHWATAKQQARNTRRNRMITINGTTKCLAEWIELSGINNGVVRQRFYTLGWPIEQCLSTSVRKRARVVS